MTAIQITSTTPGGPGFRRLRKSPQAAAVRAAVTADQRAAGVAAATKPAKAVAAPAKKPAQRSPSDPQRVAGRGRPTAKVKPASAKAARPPATIRVLSKEIPYRETSTLAKMARLLRDGMTTADLRAAFDRAGIKGSVSGFLSNARGKKLVE